MTVDHLDDVASLDLRQFGALIFQYQYTAACTKVLAEFGIDRGQVHVKSTAGDNAQTFAHRTALERPHCMPARTVFVVQNDLNIAFDALHLIYLRDRR